MIARCLVGRDIGLDDVESFLSPRMKDSMPDPLCLKGMAKGVEATAQKIVEGGKIGLFADYDVDGASSAALIIRFFKQLGIDTTPRVQQIKVEEPPKRKAGIKVASVAELVSKLKNEAKVI